MSFIPNLTQKPIKKPTQKPLDLLNDLHHKEGAATPIRCDWCTNDPRYIRYHDEEWGRPEKDEARLFELFILETQQAGLSWWTVLQKREAYRQAFRGFDPYFLASADEAILNEWLSNPELIRHRKKLEAVIHNARCYLSEFPIQSSTGVNGESDKGGFHDYFWGFVDGKPIDTPWKTIDAVPATTPLSDTISRDLKRRGFKFIGSITIYAYLQAIGVVNDHLESCIIREL